MNDRELITAVSILAASISHIHQGICSRRGAGGRGAERSMGGGATVYCGGGATARGSVRRGM